MTISVEEVVARPAFFKYRIFILYLTICDYSIRLFSCIWLQRSSSPAIIVYINLLIDDMI